MPTTPTWGLVYPASTDLPCGAQQMQALAQSADTAMTTARSKPSYPYAFMQVAAMSNMAIGALALAPLAAPSQSAHNLFAVTGGNKVTTTSTGMYRLDLSIRFSMLGTGTLGGYVQAAAETPVGTVVGDWLMRTYKQIWLDIAGACLLVAMTAGVPLALNIRNNAGAVVNMTGGRLWLTRIADLP